LKYRCRQLEKCRFEKNVFKNSSIIYIYKIYSYILFTVYNNKSYLQLISYFRIIKYAFLFSVKFPSYSFLSTRTPSASIFTYAPLSIKAYSVASFSNSALMFWEYCIFAMSNYKKLPKKIDFSDRLK